MAHTAAVTSITHRTAHKLALRLVSAHAVANHQQNLPYQVTCRMHHVLMSCATLLLCFSMCVCRAFMFGSEVSENITLDMQDYAPDAMPTVVAMWLVIVNPIAKVALTLAPVAMAMEVRGLGQRSTPMLFCRNTLDYQYYNRQQRWH
jgi:hypothetical protein